MFYSFYFRVGTSWCYRNWCICCIPNQSRKTGVLLLLLFTFRMMKF